MRPEKKSAPKMYGSLASGPENDYDLQWFNTCVLHHLGPK